jgi:PIN domain nuclease of toxin-antitoxin system
MRALIDTVVFVWALTAPERVSKRAMAVLAKPDTVRLLSAVSLSELAIKRSRGKLDIGKEQVVAGVSDLQLRILPYTAQHAYELFALALHHFDPFDRQIIAQAVSEVIPVITSDENFSLYKGLKIIW